ncbi:MAG: excinuclease ABC subunit UvrC [Candidatus Omnitrophica bacterium]|nr:excinuclease ABC subunit UvrC [Candidatus Omnitrophota bacterium]
MPPKKKELQRKIHDLPDLPGVYLFRDKSGRIIYAGKAVSLRNRVRSYFQASRSFDPKTELLVNEIADLEHYPTASEAEAFFLESRFIKTYQPHYNVDLRDDKTFPLVRITKSDFPRIEIIRGKKEKDAYYFGPFTEAWALRRAVRNLRRIFPLAGCRRRINPENPVRPCFDYNLKRCLAPCAGKSTKEEYNRTARALLSFFEGKNQQIISELKTAMGKAAGELNFEEAARIRDEIDVLQRVQKHPKALGRERPSQKTVLNLKDSLGLPKEPVRIEAYDISNLFGQEAVGSMVTFLAGEPCRKMYRRFRIKDVEGINDCAMMAEVLKRRFLEKEWPRPDLILIDGGRGQVETANRVLRVNHNTIPLVGLAKEKEEIFAPGKRKPLPVSRSSPESLFLQRVRDEAHRFAVSYHRNLQRKKITASSLDSIPGIGPRRKALLWRRFSSLEEIKSAPAAELVKSGIPEKVALRLKALNILT